jgi:hypothetical protein
MMRSKEELQKDNPQTSKLLIDIAYDVTSWLNMLQPDARVEVMRLIESEFCVKCGDVLGSRLGPCLSDLHDA